MTRGYAGAAVSANFGVPNVCTNLPKSCTTSAAMREVIKQIQPVKPWTFLEAVLDLKERAAKYRMTERSFDADDVERILWTEHGHILIAAMMSRSPYKPLWWRIMQPLFRLIGAKRNQIAEEKLLADVLKDLKDARTNLSAARQQVEAVVFQDPEFFSAQMDAVRGASGEQNSAVEQAARKGRVKA